MTQKTIRSLSSGKLEKQTFLIFKYTRYDERINY